MTAPEPTCDARSSGGDWCTEDRGHDLPHRDQEHCVEWSGGEKPVPVHRGCADEGRTASTVVYGDGDECTERLRFFRTTYTCDLSKDHDGPHNDFARLFQWPDVGERR